MLMKRLGNPQRNYRIIHVTGTAIERFCGPDGKLMDAATFVKLARLLYPHIEAMDQTPCGTPSYLEAIVAIALLYFFQQRCEWVVLEVGMGGRWDATSIIPAPAVAVVTPIDNDHLHLIGPTLRDVAINKSFIIKRGSHVFTSEQRPRLREVLRARCKRAGARWHEQLLPLPQGVLLAIPGAHQRKNARLAFSVGRHLNIPEDACLDGIAATRLPCRFEIVQTTPTVILDGAHNALAARSLTQSIAAFSPRRLIILLALAENKSVKGILQALPPAHTLMLTRFISASRASMSPGSLRCALQRFGLGRRYERILVSLDPHEALDSLLRESNHRDVILATGSLYLTGSLRKRWIPEGTILKARSSF